MTYDNLDRLTQTTSPSAVFNTASYGYDVLDNLTYDVQGNLASKGPAGAPDCGPGFRPSAAPMQVTAGYSNLAGQ